MDLSRVLHERYVHDYVRTELYRGSFVEVKQIFGSPSAAQAPESNGAEVPRAERREQWSPAAEIRGFLRSSKSEAILRPEFSCEYALSCGGNRNCPK